MERKILLTLLVAATMVVAGCAQRDDGMDDDNDGTPPPDAGDGGASSGNYTLTATGVPATAVANQSFTFTLRAEGPAGTSDHVGGHFGTNSTDQPSVAAYPGACVHTAQTLPGTYTVACTLPRAGTWYLRGHVRTGAAEAYRHFWAAESTIVVTPRVQLAYNVTTSDVPGTVRANETFTFTLNATGPPGVSDHVGAHFGTNSTTSPSVAAYPSACVHSAQTLPGTYTVSCRIPRAGTWYLRGHVRTGVEGAYGHHWADEDTILVTA